MSRELRGGGPWCRLGWGAVIMLLAGLSYGQVQLTRDPTVPPAEALPAPASDGQAGRAKGEQPLSPSIVIVREGQAAVVSGTRLYATGQTVGQARIERITETEVWFSEAGALRKVPRYAGVQRGPALPDCPAVAPSVAASAALSPAQAKGGQTSTSKPKPAVKPARKAAPKRVPKAAPQPVAEVVPCFGGPPKASP